ncbi:MAG: hypothetical protein AB7P03_11050 [Kofleriaceae bacterium]
MAFAHTLITAIAVASTVTLAGCGNKRSDVPSCGDVGKRFLTLAHAGIERAKPDSQTERAVTDQLPAMRDSLVRACTDTAWSAEVRKCLVSASDDVRFAACESQLTDDQRRALDRRSSSSGSR